MKKVKWGILGCGNIAKKFINDLALVESGSLEAVASRSKEKAAEFAKIHQARKSYGSYEELLADKDVDIVYIATPHPFHAMWSIKAMECGKHVLCEKPSALNKRQTEQILATSKKTNRFFMEALWTRFLPSFKAIISHIKNDDIGEISYIDADFSFKSNHPLSSRVYNFGPRWRCSFRL